MTADQPRINQTDFATTLRSSLVAIIPGERLVEVTAALAGAGVDLTRVEVLQGETGARILDFDGAEHGFWAHEIRTLQKLGTASNERENFAHALRAGGSVVIVPVSTGEDAKVYARAIKALGGQRIIHFGRHAVEQLSY